MHIKAAKSMILSQTRWPAISHTRVILDKSSQIRKITPPSPPTIENMKYITRGRNVMKREKTRRKEKKNTHITHK